MPRKKIIKWTSKIEDFILDEMIKGKDPSNIFKDNADKLPDIRTFHRRQIDDVEFREKVDAAYTVQYQMLKAELHELSTKTTSQILPDADFKEAAEYKRTRIDALKFELGKLAGVFSRRYDKKQTLEIDSGSLGPSFTFIIPDYSADKEQISSKCKVIDHQNVVKVDDKE